MFINDGMFFTGKKKKTTCDLWGLIFDNQLGFNWKLSYGRCCARFWEGKSACLHFHSQHGKKFQTVKAQCWSVRVKIFSICPSLALVAGIENQILSFAPGSPTHSRNPTQSAGYPGTGWSLCMHMDFCTIWATDSVFEKTWKPDCRICRPDRVFLHRHLFHHSLLNDAVFGQSSVAVNQALQGWWFFFFLSFYCANKHHRGWFNEVATCGSYLGCSCIWVIPYWLCVRTKAFKPTPKFTPGIGSFLKRLWCWCLIEVKTLNKTAGWDYFPLISWQMMVIETLLMYKYSDKAAFPLIRWAIAVY